MNGIIGFAALLRETALTAEQRLQITLIQEAGRSLIAIINDILDVASVEHRRIAIHPAPHKLDVLADSARSFVQNDANAKGLAIVLDVAADTPAWVYGDASRIRQILLNLLTNAIKFAADGTVTLRVTRDKIKRQLYHFTVHDTGFGLTKDQQATLFKPFVRLDNYATRQVPGTGLGLAISKSLVEAMPGGRIGVTSQPGAGSTFWFDVELPEAEAPLDAAIEPEFRVASVQPLEVLVVEDYPVNQMIIEAMLERAGHNVTIVEDGRQAVDAVRQRQYNLVLMDMEMPIMKGVDAARAIRALDSPARDTPIVALTANAMPHEIEECLSAGMDGHLSKPLDKAELLRQLARWTPSPAPR